MLLQDLHLHHFQQPFGLRLGVWKTGQLPARGQWERENQRLGRGALSMSHQELFQSN